MTMYFIQTTRNIVCAWPTARAVNPGIEALEKGAGGNYFGNRPESGGTVSCTHDACSVLKCEYPLGLRVVRQSGNGWMIDPAVGQSDRKAVAGMKSHHATSRQLRVTLMWCTVRVPI